jgi:hypothetical protein
MEKVNPQVECSLSDINCTVTLSEEHTTMKTEYEREAAAFTDVDTCSETITSDGQSCEFYSLDGKGICVSPGMADLMEDFVPLFKCSYDTNLENNPITDCNLSGADMDLCLDPSQVNGSECI